MRRWMAWLIVAVGVLVASLALTPEDDGTAGWSAELDATMAQFERAEFAPAMARLTTLAEAGDAEAQYVLGSLYYSGIGVAEDRCKALAWYERAAGQEHPKAIMGLGGLSQMGYCTALDGEAAERYFHRAFDLGLPDGAGGLFTLYAAEISAEYWGRYDRSLAIEWAEIAWDANFERRSNGVAKMAAIMGYLHNEGKTLPRDPRRTEMLYRFAARHGFPGAQYLLGVMLIEMGDYDRLMEGLTWLYLAVDGGDERAGSTWEEVTPILGEERIAEAQRRARHLLLDLAADTDLVIGQAAKWCRVDHPDSIECLRRAFEEYHRCNPQISQAYFEERFMASAAYDLCRSEANDAYGSTAD